MTDILLIVETVDNVIPKAGLEPVGLVSQVKAATGMDKAGFLITGSDIQKTAGHLADQTGFDVFVSEHPDLRYPNPERLAEVVERICVDTGCRFICFLHTSSGSHAAAKTAIIIGAACVAGVDRITGGPEELVLRSALFNGKMCMETIPDKNRLVMTVLPGAFHFNTDEKTSHSTGNVIVVPVDDEKVDYIPLDITRAAETDTAIDKADILVAVGRGLGDIDNLSLVEDLVRLLPNAAIAASRPLCDLKWLPYSRQVGATGKIVAPRLYLACGISGAQQHVYGMKESQLIVAINNDPGAAIFSIADYCIVEDLITFLQLLIETRQYTETEP